LEAAHIKWKQHGGPCEVPNGLALCAIHHKAFDKGSIGLDEDMRVLVSESVNGNNIVIKFFIDYAGKKLKLPLNKAYHPRKEYLKWHMNEVFKN
ncbi:MAG: HNH endonuclease, partial [Staphylococcus sp.]|nr:HNH endonuclease [Staphylococcus sp.]